VVTTVAADDLEGVPVAAFPTALHDADRLAPDARGDAMPGLTSQRDSHHITGLNAAPRIAGMPSAPDANILRTASGPDTGHDMQSFGAQLNPTSVDSATARVWSSAYAICQYRARSLRQQVLDLSWIVATSEDDFNHDPFAPKQPLMRQPHRRLRSSTLRYRR
jgi:hypothetical protein